MVWSLRTDPSILVAMLVGAISGYLLIIGWMKSHPENGGIISYVRPPEEIPILSSLRIIAVLAFIQLALSLILLPDSYGPPLTVGLNAAIFSVVVVAIRKRY